MSETHEHELATFLAQDLAEIASEYARIYHRSTEDPGTAGDEGEEVWAALLRQWLPSSYEIRTKGRVLDAQGTASPQVDIVILRPGYPTRLLDKKLYLAGGVAAVFECKNTLTAAHIEKTWQNVASVNALANKYEATTPRQALVPNIHYGLLAHGHSWDKPGSDPVGVIVSKLQTLLDKTPLMRDALGIICIANLASWDVLRITYDGPGLGPAELWQVRKNRLGVTSDEPLCSLHYMAASMSHEEYLPSNPLGVLITNTIDRLSMTDSALGPLSEYFYAAGIGGPTGRSVAGRYYSIDSQMPADVVKRLPGALTTGRPQTDWALHFQY